MKPLFHPAIEDVTVEGILYALSDPVRAAIYAGIAGSACSRSCSNFLNITEKPVPKSTLSQHFKALREAGLIRSERRGVEMQNTSRCKEIATRFPGLLPAIREALNLQTESNARAAKASKRRLAARAAKAR